jgi:hypothetical protein
VPIANDAFYLIDHRILALVMAAILLLTCEVGFRWGARREDMPDSMRSQIAGIGGATLGLMGLLLGFSLSMAISRWDARRDVIINEANAIGTLSLRAGLLEERLRADLRESLRDYAEARIALAGDRTKTDVLHKARRDSEDLHADIWAAVERANVPGQSNAVLSSLINSANEVIDIHELRLSSLQNRLPTGLFYLLVGMAALSVAFQASGFGATSRFGRGPPMLLAILITTVLLLIMDVNRPQRGSVEVGVAPLERALMGIPI